MLTLVDRAPKINLQIINYKELLPRAIEHTYDYLNKLSIVVAISLLNAGIKYQSADEFTLVVF